MSISIEVIAPVDINEPIVSMRGYGKKCGNFLYMPVDIDLPPICEDYGKDGPVFKRSYIIAKVIEEMDKKNEGVFNDRYLNDLVAWKDFVDREWAEWEPLINSGRAIGLGFKNRYEYCGWMLREHFRKDLVRFYTYYKAGFKIRYDDLITED